MTSFPLLTVEAAAGSLGVSREEVLAAVADLRLVGYRVTPRRLRIEPDLSGFHRPAPASPPARARPRNAPAMRERPPLPSGRMPDSRVRRRRKRPRGFVYFIGAREDSPIKVGWTVRVEGRIGALQTGCWDELVCHGALAADEPDERLLHEALVEHRLRGEWFARGPALDLLAELSWFRGRA